MGLISKFRLDDRHNYSQYDIIRQNLILQTVQLGVPIQEVDIDSAFSYERSGYINVKVESQTVQDLCRQAPEVISAQNPDVGSRRMGRGLRYASGLNVVDSYLLCRDLEGNSERKFTALNDSPPLH